MGRSNSCLSIVRDPLVHSLPITLSFQSTTNLLVPQSIFDGILPAPIHFLPSAMLSSFEQGNQFSSEELWGMAVSANHIAKTFTHLIVNPFSTELAATC